MSNIFITENSAYLIGIWFISASLIILLSLYSFTTTTIYTPNEIITSPELT